MAEWATFGPLGLTLSTSYLDNRLTYVDVGIGLCLWWSGRDLSLLIIVIQDFTASPAAAGEAHEHAQRYADGIYQAERVMLIPCHGEWKKELTRLTWNSSTLQEYMPTCILLHITPVMLHKRDQFHLSAPSKTLKKEPIFTISEIVSIRQDSGLWWPK